MKMDASLGRTYHLQNQTQNETVHVILTALRFYIALNTINLLNLLADEEAMHRQFATRRTSVKRQSRGFAASQSRYLKLRYTHIWVT